MNNLIGEIRLFPYEKAPDGWSYCNGQNVYIAQFPKLYMVISTKFGGNGKSEFKLPDLRAIAPINMMYYIAVDGEMPNIW